MAKKIYMGNLSFRTEEDSLSDYFAQYGEVLFTRIITDRESGRSRGFGFVEMADDNQADEAIKNLHNQEFDGRNLNICEAHPKREGERMRRDYRY